MQLSYGLVKLKTSKKKLRNKVHSMNLVGIDDGNYGCKLTTRKGNDTVSVIVPSLVRKGLMRQRSALDMTNMGGGIESRTFSIEDQIFSTGNVKNDANRAISRSYSSSCENLAVVHNALLSAGLGGKDVAVMTGLPFSYYYQPNGEVNKALVKAKKERFKSEVAMHESADKCANIEKHFVMAQGEAAYFDILVDMSTRRTSSGLVTIGEPRKDILESNVLVLDMGGGTTDVVVVGPNGVIDHARSGSFEHAGYKLIADIESAVRARFEIVANLGRQRYEDALKTGKLKINASRVVDVGDIRKQVVAEHFDSINERANAIVGSLDDIDIVVPVGGTPSFFTDEINAAYSENQVIWTEDAINSNSRGMFKRLYLTMNSK